MRTWFKVRLKAQISAQNNIQFEPNCGRNLPWSGETVKSKHLVEKFCREHNIPKIKKYRAYNLPFHSQRYMNDVNQQNQLIYFSGVGAHHQNGFQ